MEQFCQSGWPPKHQVKGALEAYQPKFTIQKGLLMSNSCIVIPGTVQREMLDKLHCGHQGIVKCRLRAQQSVWWLGLSKQLEELVRSCPICSKECCQHKEPLLPTQFPNLPWQKVASNQLSAIIINYFS